MKFDKRVPIYQQLMDEFKNAFVKGEYQPGQSLPSRREVAQKYLVNPNTVQKAFREMEESGLIVTEPNVASRVTEDVSVIYKLKREILLNSIEDFYQQINILNMDLNEAIEILKDFAQEKEGKHD